MFWGQKSHLLSSLHSPQHPAHRALGRAVSHLGLHVWFCRLFPRVDAKGIGREPGLKSSPPCSPNLFPGGGLLPFGKMRTFLICTKVPLGSPSWVRRATPSQKVSIFVIHTEVSCGVTVALGALINSFDMLSEISQRKTNTVWQHLYVESKK